MNFAIRADGDFTSRIASLKPGADVRVIPPYGRYAEFIREHDERNTGTVSRIATPLVLIGGGIGITPLIGVLTAYAGAGRIVDFFYTARGERDIIYRNELEQIGASSPTVRVRIQTQRPSEQTIAPMIRPGAIYLIAGPHGMLVTVRRILLAHGVAADDIYYEPFAM